MKLSQKLASILSYADPNSILYGFADLTTFLEQQVSELDVAENNIIFNEMKRIAETVLQNYIRLGLDLGDAKNTRELLLKVNDIINSNIDDILQLELRPTAYGVEQEINMLKVSILKEIITQFANVFGLTKEPIAVPLLYSGGQRNEEEIRKIRELLEKEKMTFSF
ncbi:hypothetical protein AVU39_gp13 [Sulfolobus monocaudavirus SMV2]|uniref:hypothetical protein n=1 Tax=Sulfolobus monocaudavirus SMV2 TaxID=1580591 RepID=UPI0006D31701|nr:hypothetical protein AVU39_gp13 [Sulfolobus monocaudavirus SMV2]AIZ11347.1 hypothetical protein [Sulfolobus monocaudavirus SMV2]